MKKINLPRLLVRTPLLLAIVSFFIVLAGVASIIWRGRRRLQVIVALNKLAGRVALSLLRLKISVEGTVPADRQFFIVSNHLSYIDPLVLMASFKAIFVTSVEVKEDKFVGPLCRVAACYFVERRNKFNIEREIRDVGSYLQLGFNVALFPEGTSTNGDKILRFKSSFFQVAINEKVSVLPVCLQYLTIDGEKVTPENRDSLYWYGNIGFFPHLILILSLRSVTARIKILDEIPVTETSNRNELAITARRRIENFYRQ